MKADRAAFLREMHIRFPGAVAEISEYGAGLLHCEVAALRTYLEACLASKKEWECEQILSFVGELLPLADDALANALLVSFLEDLALGSLSDEDKSILRQRAPKDVLQHLRMHITL